MASKDLLASTINTSKAIDTDWLASDLGPLRSSQTVRLSISMASGGIVNIQVLNDGVTIVDNLNKGLALAAGSRYAFDIEMAPSDAINVQHSSGGTQVISVRVTAIPSN